MAEIESRSDISTAQYIESVLLNEYRAIAHDHHFTSFILLTLAIEFLGSCLDPKHDWVNDRKAFEHFELALHELFPQKYRSYVGKDKALDLKVLFRGKLVHLHRPVYLEGVGGLMLTQKSGAGEHSHLDIVEVEGKTQLVFIAEDFFSDFESACRKLLASTDPTVMQRLKQKHFAILTVNE